MTQEQKDLLIKDLCSRLPYGVKAYIKYWSKLDQKYYEGVYTVGSVYPSLNEIYAYTENGSVEVILGYDDHFIKPYLFPLSSMTDEQQINLTEYLNARVFVNGEISFQSLYANTMDRWKRVFEWCVENHFDICGLIPMGLANDATGLNIY